MREQQELLATRHPGFAHRRQLAERTIWLRIGVVAGRAIHVFALKLAGLTDLHYGDMTVGQLPGASLDSILSASAFHQMWSDIRANIAMCQRSCAYFDLCFGDRRSTSWQSAGHSRLAEQLFCRLSHMAISDVVLSQLEANLSGATRPQLHRS